MESPVLKDLRQFATHLEGQRTEREAEWRELGEWLLPHRGVFQHELTRQSGTRRNRRAFNAGAVQSLKHGAAGLTSGMTPANLPWFRYGFHDPEMAEKSGARAFADRVEQLVGRTLQVGGFYQAIHSFNMDFIGFGCALLFEDASPCNLARFETVQVGSFAVGLDAERSLDAVVRRVRYTAGQLAEKFGETRLSRATRERLTKAPYDPVEVVHVVRRRQGSHPYRMDAKSMPWASYFYEAEGSEALLHEGGYHDMPYFYAVWEDARSIYGTGVGDDGLSDIRQLDALERKKLLGLDKLIDPPMKIPAGLKGRVNTMPGGENAVSRDQAEGLQPLYLVNFGPALQHVQAEIQNVMARIDATLMGTVFASMPLDQRPRDMSATEYLERRRESLQLMGPALAAYEPQVLNRVLERTTNLLDKAGFFPPPPPALGTQALMAVEYVSPLAQAMRQTGAETTRAVIGDVLQLVQVAPEVLDKVDLDQAVDEMAAGIGAPGRVVRSDEEVRAIRERRAGLAARKQADAEAMQAIEAVRQVTGVVKDASTL